jgi:hypothetical protein
MASLPQWNWSGPAEMKADLAEIRNAAIQLRGLQGNPLDSAQ